MLVLMSLFMLWCLGYPALAQDRDYGRSMVVTDRGIVATSQVLESQAGAHIFERGGPLSTRRLPPRRNCESNREDIGEPIKCTIVLESRVSPEVQNQLREKSHELVLRKDYSAVMGRGQAVLHNPRTGTNFAASDPRVDGSAEPEAMPKQ